MNVSSYKANAHAADLRLLGGKDSVANMVRTPSVCFSYVVCMAGMLMLGLR